MNRRTVALVFGIIFILVGILGFIPAFVTEVPTPPETTGVIGGVGLLLGLFPVNWIHNIIHLAFGIWGVVAYRNAGGAVGYLKAVAVIYAVLTVMGFIPVLRTTFGLAPLYGHDIWLHALLAIGAGYFGFVYKEASTVRSTR